MSPATAPIESTAVFNSAEPPPIVYCPIDHLFASPTQPRKHFEEEPLQELAEDIKLRGVIQPPLVRPVADRSGYEIVYGERRIRAARLAGMEKIPVIIRELTDIQVREIQLVENLKRVDLNPREEAESFQNWLDLKDGEGNPVATVKDVAARLGKSTAYVYKRLQIPKAPAAALDALEQGKLSIDLVSALGRIPNAAMRDQATNEILHPEFDSEPMNGKEGLRYIAERFNVRLNAATFKLDDAELVPSAGPCTTCPYRTGNNPDLYPDAETGDVCAHPACFRSKIEAEWKRLQSSAEQEGKKILSMDRAEEIFLHDGRMNWDSPYVDIKTQPDRNLLIDDVKKIKSWKQYLAGSPATVEIVVARDPRGNIRELVDRKQAVEAVRLNGHDIFTSEAGQSAGDKQKEQRKKEKAEKELEDFKTSNAFYKLYRAIESAAQLPANFWAATCRLVIESLLSQDAATFVAKKMRAADQLSLNYGVEFQGDERPHDLLSMLVDEGEKAKVPDEKNIPLFLSLLVARDLRFSGVGSRPFKMTAELFGIEPETAGDEEVKPLGPQWDRQGNSTAPERVKIGLPAEPYTVDLLVARIPSGWLAGFECIVKGRIFSSTPNRKGATHASKDIALGEACRLAVYDLKAAGVIDAVAERAIHGHGDTYFAMDKAAKGAAKLTSKKVSVKKKQTGKSAPRKVAEVKSGKKAARKGGKK